MRGGLGTRGSGERHNNEDELEAKEEFVITPGNRGPLTRGIAEVPLFASGLRFQEIARRDACLLQNCAQSALRDTAWVVGDGDVAIGNGVESDLVGTCVLTVELKSQLLEPSYNLSILETGKSPHTLGLPKARPPTRSRPEDTRTPWLSE